MNNKPQEVIYQTPTGQNAKGYFINGKTYKDSAGTQRIDIGSTVPTAGGTFTLTGAGGVKTPSTIANDLRGAYKTSAHNLDGVYTAQKGAINAAMQNQENQTKRQKKNVQAQYADANRAAYQAYMNASNPYGAADEQRARLGLANSGYSETSKMQLANTYQQSIGENTRARDEYINELDNALMDAKLKGDIELANALGEHKLRVYQHGIDAAEAIAAQENAAYNAGMEANRDMWNRAMDERRLANEDRQFYADEAYRNRPEIEEERLWNQAYKLLDKGYELPWILEALGLNKGSSR